MNNEQLEIEAGREDTIIPEDRGDEDYDTMVDNSLDEITSPN